MLLALARVALDHLNAFHDYALFGAQDLYDLAAFTLLSAGNNDDLVALLHVKFLHNSDDLRRQGNDLHELLFAQLASHWTKNARAARIVFGVDDHDGVGIEPQIRAIAAADRLPGADHDRVNHLALFYRSVGRCFLDMRFDNIADAGIALVAPKHADGREAFGSGVVGYLKNGANL